MTPGIHRGLSMAEYLRIPAVSTGIVRTLLDRCPRAAWAESWLNPNPLPPDDSDASDAGTIGHAILLEGSEACCEVVDPKLYPAKTTGAIPDGWTNVSIRAKRDEIRAAGRIPILAPAMQEIRSIVDSARAFIDGLRDSEPAIYAAFQPGGGESETTLVWDDGGTLCRARPDRLRILSASRALIVDAKFTNRSAEPYAWARSQLVGMGYYLSAAFYARGVRALYGVETEYVFLVVECEPPYLCSLVGVDPAMRALADAKVETGLAQWRRCVERGHWPAYAPRVYYPELPAYEAAKWEEREAAGDWRVLFPELAEEVSR
jgi:hypothetical protein